jgi:uncharacterized membrane protein YphA (DoxX/SURF4 family)
MSFADKLNLLNEFNLLRVLCGAFFVPHIYAKFFVPQALGFFQAAGFRPAATWMYVACIVEIALAIGLILALYTSLVAWVAAFHLGIAAAAVYRVTGGKWLWNIGGYEYCLFWALCCVVVAMHG